MKISLLKLLSPQPAIGGLDINEMALRFVGLNEKEIKKISIILEPGIIEGGKLKDKDRFLRALKQIRQSLGNPKDKIYTIVSIPPHNVFTQVFNLPAIKKKQVKEAADLNLQLISPIDIKTAYFDSEEIGDPQNGKEKLELLGAFVENSVVNEFVSVLNEGGFRAVAVEFPALAVARLLKEKASALDLNKPQVVLFVSGEGLIFSILKKGKLYFNYFVPWYAVEERQISFKTFKEVLIQETRRLLTFYSSHWDGQISDMVIITQGLFEEIKKIIQDEFPFITIKAPVLNNKFSALTVPWYIASGSALRGLLPRSADVFISLMTVGTEQEFFEDQIFSFIRIWRNVILTTCGFLLVVFLFGDSLLAKISSDLKKQIIPLGSQGEGSEAIFLREKAEEFNRLVDEALVAKSKANNPSILFENIRKFAGENISITRIFVSADGSVSLIASAVSESAAINFKNKLVEEGGIKDVTLPLSNITVNSKGGVDFTLSFKQ